MQVCGNAVINKSESMQMQICKYAGMQVLKYKSMQIFKHASM